MVCAPRWLYSILVAVTGLTGCATSGGFESRYSPDLPTVPRGSVEANLRTLPSLAPRDATAAPAPHPYHALTAGQCQCLAAAAAVPPQLLEDEAGLIGPRSRGAEVRRAVLTYTAHEIRNRTAGAALEAYYHLAEAEGKADLLGQSLSQLDRAVRETREMTAQNLKPPVALDVWTRQLLTAQGDQIQADMTITQLNGELRRLCALPDGADGWRIWNPEPYDISDAGIDVDAAVAEGLARRPELLLLRLLLLELDAGTLPAGRDLLRSVQPLLGASSHLPLGKTLALLHLHLGERSELATRRRQLQEYLAEREAAVADEVRQAAAALRSRTQLVAVAWAREKSWEEKAKEVQSRQKQGLASSAEMTSTTLELLKSRGEVIQEVMAWHIARAKLRQAQGLLSAECAAGPGYCR